MHIVTFMVSLSGFEISSDEDEPSLQPENPDDIESNPMQPPMIGPLPVILPQQPAPAAAGGNTTALLSAIQKADRHLPIGYFAYNTYSAYYVLTWLSQTRAFEATCVQVFTVTV